MDADVLAARIQRLEEENHLLAGNFKETNSALLDYISSLEQETRSGEAGQSEERFPPSAKKNSSRPSHALADQARTLLQTDDLGKFRKLVTQGFPLDCFFPDTGCCTSHLDFVHECVKAGAMKVVNFLRSQNVNLNAITDQSDNVVVTSRQTLAAELNQHDTLCVLLQHAKEKINVEHINKLGLNGIQIAVKNGFKEIVGLLSEHGANLQVVNGLGDTLIQMAQRAGHQDIVVLLVNVGAPLR